MNHKYEPRIHSFRTTPSEEDFTFLTNGRLTFFLKTIANKVGIKNDDRMIHGENSGIAFVPWISTVFVKVS